MQGNIDFTGSLSGSIAGGSGGSDITITPTLQSGTKIADYTIDGESGALYSPSGGITKAQQPLLILGDTISIDLNHYYDKETIDYTLEHSYQKKLYAYTPIQITGNDYNEISLTFDINNYATKNYVQSNFQPTLTAGTNVSIENNVISCTVSGSSWDYSTSEVDTGQKWIDGKTIYCRVLDLGSDTTFNVGWNSLIPHNNYYDTIIDGKAIYSGGYMQQVGIAVNDVTYMEMCVYYQMSSRYIIVRYTKK